MNNVFLIQTLSDLFFLYQRTVARVRDFSVQSLQVLEEIYLGFWKKQYRLILAFQHPSTVEPALWPAALAHKLRLFLKKHKKFLLPYAHLVYDHRIPFWAGDYLQWLLPATGALPIRRGLPDKEGLNRIRQKLLNGPWPVMMAPEGGRTWRQDRWADLEDGLGLLALWTYQDLKKKNSPMDVRILPLRSFFHWPTHTRGLWFRLLQNWEENLGLSHEGSAQERLQKIFKILGQKLGYHHEASNFDAWRKGIAAWILAKAGGNPSQPFLKELRYREGLLYLPYRKRLPDQIKTLTNLLGAGELIWFLDYPWQENFCENLDQAWELMESLKSFAELLNFHHLVPVYPVILRDAELVTGQYFDLSQAPELDNKAKTLEWIRLKILHDGRPCSENS
jgi:hypothetical protein